MSKAFVVWEFEYDKPDLKEYAFDTRAERDAFLLGVSVAEPSGEWHAAFCSRKAAEEYLRCRGD